MRSLRQGLRVYTFPVSPHLWSVCVSSAAVFCVPYPFCESPPLCASSAAVFCVPTQSPGQIGGALPLHVCTGHRAWHTVSLLTRGGPQRTKAVIFPLQEVHRGPVSRLEMPLSVPWDPSNQVRPSALCGQPSDLLGAPTSFWRELQRGQDTRLKTTRSLRLFLALLLRQELARPCGEGEEPGSSPGLLKAQCLPSCSFLSTHCRGAFARSSRREGR